jgi:hypothetical protein
MTISQHRRLRTSIVTLGVFLTGAVCADRAEAQRCPSTDSQGNPLYCTALTLNADVQVTKLHPAVTHVAVQCWTAPLANGDRRTGMSTKPVLDRGYAGTLTTIIDFPPALLAIPANRTTEVTCNLRVGVANGQSQLVAATVSKPENIVPALPGQEMLGNWQLVATGSVIAWTQTVTFPNANVAP